MFSFLGRGVCEWLSSELHVQLLTVLVYIFIGSVAVGPSWYRILPGTLVGVVGIGYVALEFIPSIEPPANMRYVLAVGVTKHSPEY